MAALRSAWERTAPEALHRFARQAKHVCLTIRQAEPQSLQVSGFQDRALEPVGGDPREVSISSGRFLEPWLFELAGVVVDESRDPVQDFEIKTFSDWTVVETDCLTCEDGSFRIRTNSIICYYEVHANSKAIFTKQVDSNWADKQTNERVVMSNGHNVVGTVAGKAIGTNVGEGDVQIQLERFPSPDYTHFKQNSGDAMIASTIVEPDGSFRLSHVADESYKLVTTHFGHVVDARPVVVDKKNVIVAPIELPPLTFPFGC